MRKLRVSVLSMCIVLFASTVWSTDIYDWRASTERMCANWYSILERPTRSLMAGGRPEKDVVEKTKDATPIITGSDIFDETQLIMVKSLVHSFFLHESYQKAYSRCSAAILKYDPDGKKTESYRKVDEINRTGTDYFDKGEYDQAILYYSKAIELDKIAPGLYANRGNAYQSKGQYNQAISDYDQAIKIKADYATAYEARGRAYHAKGSYDQAIKDFSKAIDLDPKDYGAYHNRGNSYRAKGLNDQAIADYNKAIELKEYELPYNDRGNAYLAKKQYDLAIADYSKAINLNPNYTGAYNNRGIAYERKGQYDAVIADFSKVIDLKPEYAVAYYHRANAYAAKGLYDEAIADYSGTIRLNPKEQGAYYGMACIYSLKNNTQEACDYLKKSIDLGFNNWEHIKKDKDLNNIRQLACYQVLMDGK